MAVVEVEFVLSSGIARTLFIQMGTKEGLTEWMDNIHKLARISGIDGDGRWFFIRADSVDFATAEWVEPS